MSVNVYAWPPVAAVGAEWTEIAPVQKSRSLITGAEYLSGFGRTRRFATIAALGHGPDKMGAGYMEALKRYLAGVHLVRLQSFPINWHVGVADGVARSSQLLKWKSGTADLEWTSGGNELIWLSGRTLWGTSGADASGFPAIEVSGLPPQTLIARPGEFLEVFEADGATLAERVMIARPATSDAAGVASVRLLSLSGTYSDRRINLGARDTGVFRPIGDYPRAVQPVTGSWRYTWEFREVFEDEVGAGGFVEVDPWQ